MVTSLPVFHHAPKPISVHEFRDAIFAICKPRFPTARYARPQRLALAVSGGVDSMAMAFLFSNLIKTYHGIKIADYPTEIVGAMVIDHAMRPGSDREVVRIREELKKIRIRVQTKRLRWRGYLKYRKQDPSELSNVESLARMLRYQAIGSLCLQFRSSSVFLAHHSDDQYETVLMRLLGGHGYRGLQGMRQAGAIPECYEMHGVYQSGFLDDQMMSKPLLSFKPGNRDLKILRDIFRGEKMAESWDPRMAGIANTPSHHFPGHINSGIDPNMPYLKPLSSEDGGLTVYRPLLEFDKARLKATCEANNVKWFEDHTNEDPTLTSRNAVRRMVRDHELPLALQKPAILALSERTRRRARAEEAEARRLLLREAVVRDFDPNAGTLLAELPTFAMKPAERKRWLAEARARARRPHRRLIAAIAVRKLIDFVTPETHLPALASLDNTVSRLFPNLVEEPSNEEPKAFSIAGVLFDPVTSEGSTKWFLSRTPYPSNQPLPQERISTSREQYPSFEVHGKANGAGFPRPDWFGWRKYRMFDGRYWLRLNTSVRAAFHIEPFQAEYGKAFRKFLAPYQRARLERLLKYYAPGKVRYSLPALYSAAPPDGSRPGDYIAGAGGKKPKLTLIALPTLGIAMPGAERWVKCLARYKHVDTALLGQQRGRKLEPLLGYKAAFSSSRRKRRDRIERRARGEPVKGVRKSRGWMYE